MGVGGRFRFFFIFYFSRDFLSGFSQTVSFGPLFSLFSFPFLLLGFSVISLSSFFLFLFFTSLEVFLVDFHRLYLLEYYFPFPFVFFFVFFSFVRILYYFILFPSGICIFFSIRNSFWKGNLIGRWIDM